MELNPGDISSLLNGTAGGGMWNNPFMYLIWLSMFRNGTFGQCNDPNAVAAAQGALTRAELTDGFLNQDLMNEVRAAMAGISGINNTIQSGNADISQQLCQGFGSLLANMNTNTNALNNSITQSNFNTQMGLNSLNNNLSSIKYEMAQNCCDIKNAMHAEGEATRGLMTTQEMQNLRDSREAARMELQSAQLALANSKQTQDILSSIGRYVPYLGSNPMPTCVPACSGW
jgi:multidrug resistance efflux pump